MKVKLVSLAPNGRKSKLVLKKLPVVIGRGTDAEVRLPDRWASRRHCEIYEIEGAPVVRDLGSTHGTFINGHQVTESHLMPGDRLTVGLTSFQAHYKRNRRRADPSALW
jgi:pSer/pThr/pTyr-binding forkhead associated (FHA) protein